MASQAGPLACGYGSAVAGTHLELASVTAVSCFFPGMASCLGSPSPPHESTTTWHLSCHWAAPPSFCMFPVLPVTLCRSEAVLPPACSLAWPASLTLAGAEVGKLVNKRDFKDRSLRPRVFHPGLGHTLMAILLEDCYFCICPLPCSQPTSLGPQRY